MDTNVRNAKKKQLNVVLDANRCGIVLRIVKCLIGVLIS